MVWTVIGRALAIGKAHAVLVAGTNAACAGITNSAPGSKQLGFERMTKSVRSVAIELAENIEAITAWRETPPGRRLVHPLSNVRPWRASLNCGIGKRPKT